MARTHSDETRAACMAALLQGQSVSAVAKEYDVPKGTVSRWCKRAHNEGVRPVRTQKADRIGTLLVSYLETNLATLQKQAEAFADPAWLAKQGAADVAVLHGVMTDKAVRLLEAFGRAEDPDAEDPDGDA